MKPEHSRFLVSRKVFLWLAVVIAAIVAIERLDFGNYPPFDFAKLDFRRATLRAGNNCDIQQQRQAFALLSWFGGGQAKQRLIRTGR